MFLPVTANVHFYQGHKHSVTLEAHLSPRCSLTVLRWRKNCVCSSKEGGVFLCWTVILFKQNSFDASLKPHYNHDGAKWTLTDMVCSQLVQGGGGRRVTCPVCGVVAHFFIRAGDHQCEDPVVSVCLSLESSSKWPFICLLCDVTGST